MLGLKLVGQIIGEELLKPFETKGGDKVQNKVLLVKIGDIDVVKVEVSKDYKIEKNKDGNVVLPVNASARTWDNTTKSYQFVGVKYYVPRQA